MEDPNYEQTDIFAFMMEKPAGKKQRVRTKKAALSSEQKRAKAAVSEEASLFGKDRQQRRSRLAGRRLHRKHRPLLQRQRRSQKQQRKKGKRRK